MLDKQHIIVCALSYQSRELAETPDEYTYDGGNVEGKQTNEAPVKYLVRKARGKVKRIVYLCSPEC